MSLSSLGSVYLGKDIMTGTDVALKIGHPCSPPLRLSHEHNMYTTITGSRGISQVLWYSKEGVYEVIVMDNLGTSLGDLINQIEFDHGKTFLYATQMVCLLYNTNNCIKHTLTCSSQQSSHFMITTTSIVTSNPEISCFTLITFVLPSSLLISA
jgi:serine/threonine protein kinase